MAEFHASDRVVRGGVKLPAVLAAATPDQQGQLVTVLARAAVAHYDNDRQAPSRDVLDALDTALDRTPALRRAAPGRAGPRRSGADRRPARAAAHPRADRGAASAGGRRPRRVRAAARSCPRLPGDLPGAGRRPARGGGRGPGGGRAPGAPR
ncbi:hypothetical protein ACFQ0M_43105 [Kitasatospora aburaviensis]